MIRRTFLWLAIAAGLQCSASAGEAKLVRYPDFHDGKIVFSYLGDIWTADEDGKNIDRLTVHTARDIHPRFSPDGRSIAFSSDREGNMDVYVIPTAGGAVKRLTIHSADDTVLDWTPDGKSVLFASQRGEDFMGKLYVVSIDGGMPRDAGPDMGVAGSYSPDGNKLAVTRKAQAYWRKYYRGAYQSDITVMDLASKTFKDLAKFEGMDSWPLWSKDGFIYFVSDREGKGQTNIWRVDDQSAARADHPLHHRRRSIPGYKRRRQDDRLRARLRHLEARHRQPASQAASARNRRRNPADSDRVPRL